MKKIITTLVVLIVVNIMAVNSNAVNTNRLPLANDNTDYIELNNSVILKSDLIIEKSELLVIPKGIKMVLSNKKTINVYGRIFIENGGNLIINSGNVIINENASIVSCGKILLKSKGKLTAKNNSNIAILPSGSFYNLGTINTDLRLSNITCLGNYSGDMEGIKAEIIGAVRFDVKDYYLAVYENYEVVEKDSAQELFPDSIKINKYDSQPAGASIECFELFCSNGETIELLYYGSNEKDRIGLINGIVVLALK